MISVPVYGKSKMNRLEYFFYGLKQGWVEVYYSIQAWSDLMTGNTEWCFGETEEEKFQELRLEFFDSLSEEVYPKEFIEELYALSDRIRSGEEPLYEMPEDEWKQLLFEIDNTAGY